MDGVEIGLSLPSSNDRHETVVDQFGDKPGHARHAHAHFFGETFLPGEAAVVVPRVGEKHGVGQLGSNRKLRVTEDEIRHLRKTAGRDGVEGVERNVLLDDFADGFHAVIVTDHRAECTGPSSRCSPFSGRTFEFLRGPILRRTVFELCGGALSPGVSQTVVSN